MRGVLNGRDWQAFFGFGIDAAGDPEEIGVAVVIEIGKTGAPADVAGFDGESGGQRDVAEIPFAIVFVEDGGVFAEVSFEDVEIAVEFEIADGDAHACLHHAVFAEGDTVRPGLVR